MSRIFSELQKWNDFWLGSGEHLHRFIWIQKLDSSQPHLRDAASDSSCELLNFFDLILTALDYGDMITAQ